MLASACFLIHSLLTVQFLAVEWSYASQSEACNRSTTTEEIHLGPNQSELIPVHLQSQLPVKAC